MEASRSINHETETEATCSSAHNCNNASIIQNPGIRYDLRKPQSSSSSAAPNVLLHSPSSRYDNGYSGGGGVGRSKSGDRSTFHALHYENPNDIIITNRKMHTANLNRTRRASRTTRGRGGMHDINDSYSSKSSASSYSSTCSASSCDGSETSSNSSGEPNLPYPGFPELSLNYLTQDMRPRNWCLLLITNPWFERISILVILFNCVTLGMYQPCVDDECVTNRCKILQTFDDIIFAFFSLEMSIKMVAMGVYGKNTYLADSWNRLDFFIVLSGGLEYCLNMENLNLTAIRTIRVLRPLRAINRIPSMRILVMLLLDTLPMLGNVLLLCFFVFFIFGIVGVQLWEGILRQRCVLQLPDHVAAPKDLPDDYRVRVRINSISYYYEFSKEQDYICSKPADSGMHMCNELPPYRIGPMVCNASAEPYSYNFPTNMSCVNWNQYYTNCTQLGGNPFQGTISFDNIGMAWVAIFLVISLEGWTDIMYYVQDAHSFWDWIYFVLLIVIGSFFMINLCLVVIATQFSETKKREMERMRQERARYTSTSTIASSTNNSEPSTCYAEIVKYIAHLSRRIKRRLIKKYKHQDEDLLPNADTFTLSPHRIKCHHPNCPKVNQNKTPTMDGGARRLKSQMADTNSISGTIIQNNCNSSQLSSPDMSEANEMHRFSSSSMNLAAAAPTTTAGNDDKDDKNKLSLLKIPGVIKTEQQAQSTNGSGEYLSPPSSARRRSSVMFNDLLFLHTPPNEAQTNVKNISQVEKTTQTGDGNIWKVNLGHNLYSHAMNNILTDCSDLNFNDTMTCQELLAFSVAFSAALPTNQNTLDSLYSSLAHHENNSRNSERMPKNVSNSDVINRQTSTVVTTAAATTATTATATVVGTTTTTAPPNGLENFSCCYHLYQNSAHVESLMSSHRKPNKYMAPIVAGWRMFSKIMSYMRRCIKMLVEHKYFQQGILLAILINTLSMGIEYHDQPDELTTIVETSNIVFSGIFAVEMLLKVIAEGPFRYIANGFNVFDGVIVILSVFELGQQFFGISEGSSGLSVLRTFRLLRILKLVRFMPNLRRQLFVMLRTMDNVAIFFSLLMLFIFIFSVLGMYLFGSKFCKFTDEITGQERPCTCPEIINKHPHCECDRKHFNNILWSLVTVFQILTQEDWNVVLFNGMEKTSHWAALYFVALMTFGNYVLFNLLVAILVEGFSSERNERREREQRELVKKLREEHENLSDLMFEDYRSCSDSISSSDNFQEMRNKWHSAEDVRKSRKIRAQLQKEHEEKSIANNSHRQTQAMVYVYVNNDTHSDNELSKSKQSIDADIDKIVLENKHFRMSPKDNAAGSSRGRKMGKRNPPIITTTAATPQDSPIATLAHGMSFSEWENNCLKPPSIVGSVKGLNNLLTPEPYPSKRKIESPSNRNANTCIDLEPKASISNIRLDRKDSTEAGSNQTGTKSKSTKKSSIKKRSSTKRKESKPLPINYETDMLDSERLDSLSNMDVMHKSGKRLQNNSKNTNKISPRGRQYDPNEFCANPQQQQQQQQQQPPTPMYSHRGSKVYRRRMSTMDPQAFKNLANLDLKQLEMLRERALRREEEMKATTTTEAKEEAPVCKGFFHEPFKFTTAALRKHFEVLTEHRQTYSLLIFPEDNKFRHACDWFVTQKWFDNVILLFIALNCITLAMERPNIPPNCTERYFLSTANYVFTFVFTLEMFVKVVAAGMFKGPNAYFNSGWNIMDGSLVTISIIDLLMSLLSQSSPRIFGILRVFRLLRSLRPLRVINRAPGLKLVVQTLLSSLRPIGNIVLICCTFFIIFGILGVQLFKGTFYYCEGISVKHVKNKTDCLSIPGNVWINRKYNFDDLGKALMSLFVLSSRDGWVNIMYTGLDAVGVDQQPIVNFNEWRLLYFIAFILLVGFFVLNMFVGVVVENFHRCREEQEKEEKIRRAAKRAVQMEKKRKRMHEPPYYTNYSPLRLFVHNVVTSKYFDLAIAAVIGLNVVTMALEYYMMPIALEYALKIFNYFFTAVFILEAIMKLVALGFKLYMKDKWNQLDVGIVILSVVGIVLEELETKIIPINPTIIRVMRVLRIARVLKLLKMAKGIRALLDTVMQALPQVGNLGLLFFLLFFIFAALGVELFGRLECSDDNPCQGLGEHAHFANFGMAFLTLFRVATGDNWNGIMKDTLRDDCDDAADCVRNCCVSPVIAPIFFVIFVLMAQFVLVNVVVAVLMKHLEESHKQIEDDEFDMEELEREMVQAQKFEEEQALCMQLDDSSVPRRTMPKVLSLPSNFTYTSPIFENRFNSRRQTVFGDGSRFSDFSRASVDERMAEIELGEMKPKTKRRRSSSGMSTRDKEISVSRTPNVRPKLNREISLDERQMTAKSTTAHKLTDVKRTSCDQLLVRDDKTTNFYHKPNAKPNEMKGASKVKTEKLSSSKDSMVMAAENARVSLYRRSSLKSDYGKPNTANTLLSLSKAQSVSGRSGSCRQLFKQHAMDDEADIDENSLLLPMLNKPQIQHNEPKNAKETSLFNKTTNENE
ncbi:voltage-dependent T-type calcium channel subunit alpha-1G isoform X2 [Contarinia nasturtii]|uniref:voltage-dependent T-type calcium channel subunit alpha-1G isoform X2 n=1 Tax=Contarinia nasturtii TaxID=265458 RepID=UPI0012D3D35D|nr:voltage-dependent T-type calcium channel subunit alpha-1G isoform X2 [Contarinia nasturtii]